MEIGECIVADEDGKPPAQAQHLIETTAMIVGSTTEESGIVSFKILSFLV